MLRAVYNEAGFVNEYNPIFDPDECRPVLPPDHPQNLKIDHPILGVALAESLNRSSETDGPEDSRLPADGVGFVRGNGAVVWSSEGVEELVHRCVNLQRNAEIQTASMLQRAGSRFGDHLSQPGGINALPEVDRCIGAIELESVGDGGV